MAWKGLHLSRAAYLSLKEHQLQITFRSEGEDGPPDRLQLPLEDLDYLVIDTLEVSLSGPLLAALAESSVLVIGVDRRHIPVWAAFPWAAYYRQGDTLSLQLEASLPFKKQLWSQIVQRKILYQAACLNLMGSPREASLLEEISQRVLSGDKNNAEARAARIYWQALFASYPFQRHAEDLPNALLDYGYSLLRSALARNLCALGFIPQLGIHHCGQANAFNLADDLIEPYRPFVDLLVAHLYQKHAPDDPFCSEHRRALVQILTWKVTLSGEEVALPVAMERTVNQLKHAFKTKDPFRLVYPAFPKSIPKQTL